MPTPEPIREAAARLGLPAKPDGLPPQLLPLYYATLALLARSPETPAPAGGLGALRAQMLACLTAWELLDEDAPRPETPTRAWCLVPPRTIRWEGEVEVQPRQWLLLGVLLDAGRSIQAEDVDDQLGLSGRDDRALRVDLSRLNSVLLEISFPWTYSLRDGWVLRV